VTQQASHPIIPAAYRGTRGLDDVVRRVLGAREKAVIGTISPDGFVHMAPVWFHFDGAGVFSFECSSKSRKARNITSRGTASVMVKAKGIVGDVVIALGQGTARMAEGGEVAEVSDRIRRKYIAEEGFGPMSRLLDEIDDAAVLVTLTKWVRWHSNQVNDRIRDLPEFYDGAWNQWFPADGK
jgi:Pyridoxamine 5'-phosphate oxidase